MVRKSLNLLVDEQLVNKARNHGLNLSRFFENQLQGYFNFIEGKHQNYYNPTDEELNIKNNNSPERIRTAGAGSKGQRVNRYTTGLS